MNAITDVHLYTDVVKYVYIVHSDYAYKLPMPDENE